MISAKNHFDNWIDVMRRKKNNFLDIKGKTECSGKFKALAKQTTE